MPEAILSPAEWEAIKLASVKGVSDNELAEQYQITKESIRQRRFRDPVWSAACQASNQIVKGACNDVSQKGAETASLAKKVASSISESAAALGEQNLLLASQIASKGLKRASGAIESVPLENMADIERAIKIAAIAGKWNQPQVQVNQAFAFGGGQDDADVVNIETEIVEDTGNYGDAF